MSVAVFFAVLTGLFLISMAGYRLIFRLMHAQTALETGRMTAVLAVSGAVPLILWGVGLCLPVVGWRAPWSVVLPAVVGAGVWDAVRLHALPVKTAALILFGLNFVASFGIIVPPESLGGLPTIVAHLFMATVATAFVGLFSWFDRVPGFNVNATAGLLFLSVVMGAFFHQIPLWMSAAAVFLWILAVPLNAFVGVVGPARCIFGGIGFLWGFLLMVLAAHGLTAAGVVATGYYVFEAVFVVLFTALTAHRFVALSDSFLTERVIKAHPNDAKLPSFVMTRSLLFAAIGIVFAVTAFQTDALVYVVCLGIMSVDLYRRLDDWGAPKVRLRDLFSDMKNGTRALIKEVSRLPLKQAEPARTNKPTAVRQTSRSRLKTKTNRNAKTRAASAKIRQDTPKKRAKRA